MRPHLKKGDTADPSNYRSISVTCVFCKILEHIVVSSLSEHFIELNNTLWTSARRKEILWDATYHANWQIIQNYANGQTDRPDFIRF